LILGITEQVNSAQVEDRAFAPRAGALSTRRPDPDTAGLEKIPGRGQDGGMIDFVLTVGMRRIPLEVKCQRRPIRLGDDGLEPPTPSL